MDYNEVAKFVNELNWKNTYMFLGLSIGIVAFSIQDLSNNIIYEKLSFLFISWGLLGISFIISIVRHHHFIAIASRNAEELFEKEYGTGEYVLDKKKIQKTSLKSAILYWIMISCFMMGIISYAVFKILNLSTN